MKTLLSKIAIRKAVGMYLGEHEVSICRVASTPLGPVVTASASEPYTMETLGEVIERLLTPYIGPKKRPVVAIGLPNSRVLFSTRLVGTAGVSTAESLLQKSLLSTNISIDDLTVEMIRGAVSKMPVAHLAACRTKFMANVVSLLGKINVRPFRTEPATCALLRLAETKYRSPRRSKTAMHIFLGTNQGLAALVSGGLPLTWKTFSMTTGMEGFAVLSIVRGLTTQQNHFGIEANLDYVIIHGRPELHQQLQQEQLPSEIGTRVLWNDGPALTGESFAQGLALGCLSGEIKAFDLSRHLKARAPIKEIFPWGELGIAALVGVMAGILGSHAMKLDRSYLAMKATNSQHVCLASVTEPKALEKDLKELTEKADAMRGFLTKQIRWTTYTSDIAKRLPPEAQLAMFYGKNTTVGKKTKGGAVAFELRGSAPLSQDGTVRPDVDQFLTSLPNDKLWQRDFSPISTNIKLPLAGKDMRNEVDFTIKAVAKSKDADKPAKTVKKSKKK